ncbi:hypothetical protein MRX96_052161, partial [Rhipicephalus microplus]
RQRDIDRIQLGLLKPPSDFATIQWAWNGSSDDGR